MSRIFRFVINKYNNIVKNNIVKSIGPLITGVLLLNYSKLPTNNKYLNNSQFNKPLIIINPLIMISLLIIKL